MHAFLRGGRKLGTWNLDSFFFFAFFLRSLFFMGLDCLGFMDHGLGGPKGCVLKCPRGTFDFVMDNLIELINCKCFIIAGSVLFAHWSWK